MSAKQVKVTVTGAAGQIGYALLFRIASGQMFGPETKVELSLLELEQALPALRGVVMELDDCAYPLLTAVSVSSDANEAFKEADWALLVGSVPRKAGMERGDLLKINGGVFTVQGDAISKVAKPTCRVLVVGNPCNTNAYIAKEVAKNIPDENFFALTMLDQNRATTQLAQKAGVHTTAVSNMAIWGNHSATQYPDYTNAKIDGKPAASVISDEAWLQGEFIETVQKRGAAIIQARGASSAASAANAVVDAVRNILTPTPQGEFFSLAVCSTGNYGVPEGLIFSYPVRSDGQKIEVVEGIELDEFSREKIEVTTKELMSEKEAVQELLTQA